MTRDRAAILAELADQCMETGRLPYPMPAGCVALSATAWPPEAPREIRFSAAWPGITLVCSRSLSGYSLLGGLHRELP